jgi:hypothetical protein
VEMDVLGLKGRWAGLKGKAKAYRTLPWDTPGYGQGTEAVPLGNPAHGWAEFERMG